MTADQWETFWDRPSVPARPLARRPGDALGRPAAPRRVPFEVCLAYEYDSGLAEYAGAIVSHEDVREGDRQVVAQGRIGDPAPDDAAVLDPLADVASLESVIVDRPVRLARPLPQVQELIVTSGVAPPGDEVLRNLPNLRSLCLGRVAGEPKLDLRVLAGMPSIEDLRFDAFGVATIEPLRALSGLRRVRIENHTFESIAPLAAASRLRFVAVGWWKGMDRLGELTELEEVELNEGTLSSLRPFRRLERLRSLTVFGRRLRSLAGIKEMTALEDLFLYNPGIDDLSPLVGLPRLRRIRLDLPGRIADFGPLGRIAGLEDLIINFKGDRSASTPRLADLRELRSLRRLALTRVDGTGWRFLLDVPAIERLLLYGSVDADAPDQLRRRFPDARLEVRPVQPVRPETRIVALGDGRWALRLDARRLLAVDDNFEAETWLEERLAHADPELAAALDFDSDAESLGVIAATEADVRKVAALLGVS